MNIDWIGLAESSLDPENLEGRGQAWYSARCREPSVADGKMVRWSNIGGQPFVLTTWTTPRHKSRKPWNS